MKISVIRMRTVIVFLLGFLSLALFSCGGGRRVTRPPATTPQTTPTETTEVVTYNCQYMGGHQIVGDYSCSKRFCYTFSWCQGLGNVFLFCEASLNAEGKYICPTASACASSETVPANPALAPYLWKNNCDGGSSGVYYEDDEEKSWWDKWVGGEDDDDDDEDEEEDDKPAPFLDRK